MERLTERMENVPDGESNVWVKKHDYIKASEKLADYEDLEEQGLLLKLPCKVGDKLYLVDEYITECFVDKIYIEENGITITCVEYCEFENGVRHICGNVKLKWGKSSNFFFTLEEAEKKREEMRNVQNI